MPSVQLDAAEVDHPGQRGRVVEHGEDRRMPARKANKLLADVVGMWRHPLLVEEVTLDAVRVALHVKEASTDVVERIRRDVEVVLDEVPFRQPALRKEELLRAGDLDLVTADSHRLVT